MAVLIALAYEGTSTLLWLGFLCTLGYYSVSLSELISAWIDLELVELLNVIRGVDICCMCEVARLTFLLLWYDSQGSY